MGAVVKNKIAFLSAIRVADAKVKLRFASLVWNAIELLHHEVLGLTPVWSGSAVANYRWSVGSVDMEYHAPIDNGDPGPTNSMPLGPEPRRHPNEALSLESLYSLNVGNPFQIFYLNNNDPDIMNIEFGELPTPERSRSKNGMVRLSMEYVVAKLSVGGL